MFNIKLEENSYNTSFKALSVKYNVQKTDRVGGGGRHNVPSPGQIVLIS